MDGHSNLFNIIIVNLHSDPLNQLEEWERLKYMSFARSQLQVVMPTRMNVSCENGIFSEGSHERTRSIPFPPNLEYSHSHSTPPSGVVELSFVGQRRSMSIEVRVHTLAPRIPRSYNKKNTPRPNENRESPMASSSTNAIGSSSRGHVDLLGDAKDEMEEWSQDHDDQHVYDEMRPFVVHELASQHISPRKSSNPSLTLVAFAWSFVFHNNIDNVLK